MMGADEAGTLTNLKHHRKTVFDPTVAAHKRRVVKLIGDGTLVEFGRVVEAVKCALAIQRAVKAAAAPDGGGIILRNSINLGDDIYGDGVNVAARLEPLASPGGVCVDVAADRLPNGAIEVVRRNAKAARAVQRLIELEARIRCRESAEAAPKQRTAKHYVLAPLLPLANPSFSTAPPG
jgi:class 3 adenylate cyclase